MIEHTSPISGIAAHAGRLVATAGYDNQVILWDHARRQALGRGTHDHLANQIAFSPDGRHLVSSSSDHTARLWSVPEMKLLAVMPSHIDDVEMSAFHPSAPFVATASRDHDLCIFDFGGRQVSRLRGHAADVLSVSWMRDGRELVSSSDDGTVKRWSFEEGRLLHEHDLGGVETDTIAIGSDGTLFAGNDEGEVVVLADGANARFRLHDAGVKRLVLNEDEQLLVSLSYDRTLKVSSVVGGRPAVRAQAALPAEVWPRSCAFLDAGQLVFGTFGSSYATYDIGRDAWDVSAVRATPGLNAIAVHAGRRITVGDAGIVSMDGRERAHLGSLCNFLTPVGDRVLSGGQLGIVFDVLSGRALHQHRSPLNCGASFERAGVPHAIVGTYTGEGLVFAVPPAGAATLVAVLPLHQNAVKGVAVSGGVIFAVCADCSAAWFSVDELCEIGRLKAAHGRIANGCAALPEGRFASVSRDRRLRMWQGFEATEFSSPQTHSIKCVAASADGQLVATGSYFGVVAVFDLATSRWTSTQRVSASGISSLCVDERDRCFLASSYDGRVHAIAFEPADPRG